MWWYALVMGRLKRAVGRCYSVEAELAIVALVLIGWQATRIPLEGSVGASIAHADDVLRLERALSLDVEPWLIDRSSGERASEVLTWLYTNIHVPMLFGFMAAARLLSPARYPFVRTTFVLSFVPALLVIGAFPLAPPKWLPELGLGIPPADAELGSGSGLFHNSTAAAASQHFGFAALIAVAAIWLFPRSKLAWSVLAYPVLVFVVIVGTGNHYVLDCVAGSLTFALAACLSYRIHRPLGSKASQPQTSGAASMAVGYALIAWGFVSLQLTMPTTWHFVPDALALVVGTALVVTPRLTAKEALAETS
jgi:PAP2 superfamily